MNIYEEVGQLMGEAAANGLDQWFESRWGALWRVLMPYYSAEDDEWFDVLLCEWTAQKPLDYAPRTYV